MVVYASWSTVSRALITEVNDDTDITDMTHQKIVSSRPVRVTGAKSGDHLQCERNQSRLRHQANAPPKPKVAMLTHAK